MSRACKVCAQPLRRGDGGEHYAFCGVSGLMCRDCAGSFTSIVATWIRARTDVVERKRRAEAAAADQLELELAQERLARAELEALPLGKSRRSAA